MDEFLEKLQEDQRRMRQYLRAHGDRFKRMGEVLGKARQEGGRVFVIGEPPLDVMATLLAEEYLTQLPVLPIDLNHAAPPSVADSDEAEPAVGRMAAARQAGRHLHGGDVLVAFMHGGDDKETRVVLEAARAKRLPILVVGGLDSKQAVRRLAKVRLTLPTRGIKTVCESVFVCARIMARVARAALVEAGEQGEVKLVQVECDTCNERVFLDEAMRGARATCPLCQATIAVPDASTRRAPAPSSRVGEVLPERRGRSGRVPEVEPQEDEQEVSADSADLDDETAEAPAALDDAGPEWGHASREGGKVKSAGKTKSGGSATGKTRSGAGRVKEGEGGRRRSGEGRVVRPREDEPREPRERERERPTRRRLKPSVMDFKAPLDEDELDSAPASPTPELAPDPVGLVSQSQQLDPHRAEPTFGSGITVGSDLVPIGPPPLPPPPPPPPPPPKPGTRGAATTQSADPYALEDGFLQDLELPVDRGVNTGSGSDGSLEPEGSRRLSSRYTIAECKLRWGRGGFPDDGSPEHELTNLSSARLTFVLDPDDEAGSTLQKGDELWVRVDVPAFIEPILVRGVLKDISGTSGGGRGARATLEFPDLDPNQRRKLARAAENIGAPA